MDLLELRKRADLYQEFLELFAIVPFAILHSPGELLEQEVNSYPDGDVAPVLAVFSFVREDDFGDLAGFLDCVFSNRETLDAERRWADHWRAEALEAMLDLRSNFPPGEAGYNIRDSLRFVDLALLQNVDMEGPVK